MKETIVLSVAKDAVLASDVPRRTDEKTTVKGSIRMGYAVKRVAEV